MTRINPTQNPEMFNHYMFVIDGEVVWRESVEKHEQMEMINAVFQSNPTIVQCPDELATTIQFGWTYDGTTFSPPIE